jgi:hypothetical protein
MICDIMVQILVARARPQACVSSGIAAQKNLRISKPLWQDFASLEHAAHAADP